MFSLSIRIYHSLLLLTGVEPLSAVQSPPKLMRETGRRLELRAGDEANAEDQRRHRPNRKSMGDQKCKLKAGMEPTFAMLLLY